MSSNKIFSFNLDSQGDVNIKAALINLTTKFDSIIEWARQVDEGNSGMQQNILRLIVSFDALVSLCIDNDIFTEEQFNEVLEERLDSMNSSLPPEPSSKIIIPNKKVIPPR